MNRFLTMSGYFSALLLTAYLMFSIFILPTLLLKTVGPDTKTQIVTTFENAVKKDYELLFLGNSRLYRGINPDCISINSYNFSFDNDSYNQLYYKIKYLEESSKDWKYLVLGIDYFQFSVYSDKRNYIYANLLDPNYLLDYNIDYLTRMKYKLGYELDVLNPNKVKALKSKFNKPYLKENGQYIFHNLSNENDSVKRNIERKELQIKYFKKIIGYCSDNDIDLILLMMPCRKNELKNYTKLELKEFYSFLESQVGDGIPLLDFTNDIGYLQRDYTDITHLNLEAADRFSKQLNDSLIKIIKQ